jgi:hypothetical protein
MADSKSHHDFYGTTSMHYMADVSTAYFNETPEDLFHDQHLNLQESMGNPIAFHAEMMGEIMYYHQALQQPDAQQFAKAIVKEVNSHVENKHWQFINARMSRKMRKLYHQSGPSCNASIISPPTRSPSTRPG